MWAIRILSGTQAGHVFPMKPGGYRVGRGPTCEIKINSTSVSKEHAKVLVTDDGKVIVTDLNSRNGTFVNGVKVQNQRLNLGDKIGLHDILLDLVQVPDNVKVNSFQSGRGAMTAAQGQAQNAAMPSWAGNAALRMQQQNEAMMQAQAQFHQQQPQMGMAEPPPAPSMNSLGDRAKEYIDVVAMPGVYKLVQSMPFRFAIVLFVMIYVLAVTSLSIIPMVATTKKNIQSESMRRARSIARNVRDTYKRSLLERADPAGLDLQSAKLEEGVTDVFVINAKDGTVIAPFSSRGEFVNKQFVNKARREEREYVEFLNDSAIGASVPVVSYNADTGGQSVMAYAMVLYDSGDLAFKGSQTLSLFIQTLAIAMFAGGLLFLCLTKVIEHPLDSLNADLDDALREGRDDLRTPYQFPALEKLVSNINSALSRVGQAASSGPIAGVNRDAEAANLVLMLPIAAIAINGIDERIITTNEAFERLVGGGVSLQGRPLTAIPDAALPLSLQDLLIRLRSNPSVSSHNELRFSNGPYRVAGQTVMAGADPAYFIVTLSPEGGES
jgi:hypothetical protein